MERELRISNFQTEFQSSADSSSCLFTFLETSNPAPRSPAEGAFESPDLNVSWAYTAFHFLVASTMRPTLLRQFPTVQSRIRPHSLENWLGVGFDGPPSVSCCSLYQIEHLQCSSTLATSPVPLRFPNILNHSKPNLGAQQA